MLGLLLLCGVHRSRGSQEGLTQALVHANQSCFTEQSSSSNPAFAHGPPCKPPPSGVGPQEGHSTCNVAPLLHVAMRCDAQQCTCKTHIFDSLLGAPPVTLATRSAPSSVFSSLSCEVQVRGLRSVIGGLVVDDRCFVLAALRTKEAGRPSRPFNSSPVLLLLLLLAPAASPAAADAEQHTHAHKLTRRTHAPG